MTGRVCSIKGCNTAARHRGWCSKHYQRWLRHGDPTKVLVIRGDDEARFWSYVAKTKTCWLWTGALDADGYGCIRVAGKNLRAHRSAYNLLVGTIPEGLQIDHVRARGCRHRHCVNPGHLEPVTLIENIQRGKNKTKTRCKHGHPFSPQNTFFDESGRRGCRTCRVAAKRRFRQRRAVA